ncbi:dermonecrotic toxin domain-containing protein [Pseudomonas sp. NPDC007930]|uniref:dermonecrotic toxin domain-containing protein n=1 Tax=Pseudomonas sp. NPDC007930 TaxID=3364417 RepID=UPI0036DFCA3D
MPTHPVTPALAHIDRTLPGWLRQASEEDRKALLRLLIANDTAYRAVRSVLGLLQPLDEFAQPLLQAQLSRWYPDQPYYPDVNAAELTFTRAGTSQRTTWLEAALQNFNADEVDSVTLYSDQEGAAFLPGEGGTFARGCRNLDLGQLYRDHLGDAIDTDAYRARLRAHDIATLAVAVKTAKIKRQFLQFRSEQVLDAVLAGTATVEGGAEVECAYLTLFEVPLSGLLVMREAPQPGQLAPCVLYTPGGGEAELVEYASAEALTAGLRQKLYDPGYRAFFSRFVGQADQARFFTQLREALYLQPAAPIPDGPLPGFGDEGGDWLARLFYGQPSEPSEEVINPQGRVLLEATPWRGECFARRAEVQVERQLQSAAAIAVPTAQLDAAAQQARLQWWLGAGLNVLNVAGLFVPGLGEVMLGVWGAQVVGEIVEAVHAANEGETEQALVHLFNLIDTAIQAAALGGLGEAEAPAGALDQWHPVQTPQGERLWHGHLGTFAKPVAWPEGTHAAADGFYTWEGRRWWQTDGKAYAVARDGEGHWRLAGGEGYRPRLLGNGRGGWQLAHEQPLAWEGTALHRRLGPAAQGLSDEDLARALKACGYDDAAVRALLTDRQPLPPRVLDSLERFAPLGQAEPAASADTAWLKRDFPGLSERAAEQIVAQASEAERVAMRSSGKVPLPMAEQARGYLREGRIDRALASFYREGEQLADRDLVLFAELDRLPGWSNTVAVELRAEHRGGTLLASTAVAEGVPVKVVVRIGNRYEAFDEQGLDLATAGNVYEAVLNALPDAERDALGLAIHDGDRLRDLLFEQARQRRDGASLALGMVPRRPFYRLPKRLPDGRLGYPLSGRGQGPFSDEALLDMLYLPRTPSVRERLLAELREQAGDAPGALHNVLTRLGREYQQLDQSLVSWVNLETDLGRSLHRSNLAQLLRMAWRRQAFGDAVDQIDQLHLDLDRWPGDSFPRLEGAFDHVTSIDLSSSGISDSAALGEFLMVFPNLTHLALNFNSLRSLPASLAELPLQQLDLSENDLELAPADNIQILVRLRALRNLTLNAAADGIPVPMLEALAGLDHLHTFEATGLGTFTWTAEHFQALAQWPSLRELHLGIGGAPLAAETVQALSGLNRLQRLAITDLQLAAAPDVTGWDSLESLVLSNTGLEAWPTGIEALLQRRPIVLRQLLLDRNRLQDAPDLAGSELLGIMQQQRVGGWHGEVLDLDNNEFTAEVRQRLTEQGVLGHREAGSLSSGDEMELGEEADGWARHADAPAWLAEALAQARGDNSPWQPLLELYGRLQDTVEYEASPLGMRERMYHVLEDLGFAGHPEGPEQGANEVFGTITEQLQAQQASCDDQALYLFQQIEQEVLVWREALGAEAAGLEDGEVATLTALGRLRQLELDDVVKRIAVARQARRAALAAGTEPAPALHPLDEITDAELTDPNRLVSDDVELMLYARLHLRRRLGLPRQPAGMRYTDTGWMPETMLTHLGNHVASEITAERLLGWSLEQPFWERWIRRLNPAPFAEVVERWEGASEYLTTLLDEAVARGTAYNGPAVPPRFVTDLEAAFPNLRWREGEQLEVPEIDSGSAYGASNLMVRGRDAEAQAVLARLSRQLIFDYARVPGAVDIIE